MHPLLPPSRNPSRRVRLWLCRLALLGVGFGGTGAAPAAAPEAPAATPRITVDGAGWWRNRTLRALLETVHERGRPLGAAEVEDAAFVLVSTLRDGGWLDPRVTAVVEEAGGETRRFTWDRTLVTLLPRPLEVRAVHWEIARGVRYELETVQFSGLTEFTAREADAFFRGQEFLIGGAEGRLYTPARLARSAAALAEALRERGRSEAVVTVEEVVSDGLTGRTQVRVQVREGPRWIVAEVTLAGLEPELAAQVEPVVATLRGAPWTRTAEIETTRQARNVLHRRGHAEAVVTATAEAAPADAAGRRATTVRLQLAPGPALRTGEVRFTGNNDVRESVLRRRLRLRPGQPLDPEALESARARLARLGAFRRVEIDLQPTDVPEIRDVEFAVQPGLRREVSLLFGYGSYEQVRGGVEWREGNVFDRAGQLRVRAVQSMKATVGDVDFSIPEFLGEQVTGTAGLSALLRDEVSFEREEYRASVGARRRVRQLGGEVRADYTWESLNTRDDVLTREVVPEEVLSAALNLGFTRDRLDNPLSPHRGYRLFGRAELASRTLGGEVDFQRIEIGGTWHGAWPGSDTRWWHVGFSHGVVLTEGAEPGEELPRNKRFYPGGESSIRGYREGEASPRDADGVYVGAKATTLLNVELEQALTRRWRVVLFTDVLGVAESIRDYPQEDVLVSVGLGLRYETIVGPIRLEYGHNVSRREGDDDGALHFSIGYPF